MSRTTFPDPGYSSNSHSLLRYGVWLYFLLLIFEGALRKWFLPGLAAPLLIVRDPLALYLLFITWKRGLLPGNFYLAGMVLIGILGFCTALLIGHGNLAVAVFGARILLIQFPMMFVIGTVFNRDEVLKMGRCVLVLSIPLVILTTLQFLSPQSAWVNRGVGGDMEGAGFSGALGFFRPPGTFSFVNGNSLFFSLVAAFVFYFWLNPKQVNKLLLIGSTAAVLLSIPVSISRSLFFHVGVTIIFTIIGISRKPQYIGKMILASLGILIGLYFLNQTEFFQTATAASFGRFDSAGDVEGGLEGTLVDRYLGGMVHALFKTADQPFFGYGIGMGTNVGSMLLTGGRSFLIAEEEWERNIGELGPLLGLALIFIRLAFCAKLALAGYHNLRTGDMLPWLLLSFGLLVIPQGQWAQPTTLGFSTLIGGLLIASFRLNQQPFQEKLNQA